MIAGVLLAAGRSSRMGFNKLLAEYRGKPLVAHAIEALLGAALERVVVVTGHEAALVRAVLPAENSHVTFVDNPAFADGMSTSLRAGLDALPPDLDGAIVMLADMPFVTGAHIDAVLAEPDAIGVPVRDGVRGNPVYWPRRYFSEMRALSGDQGARALLARHAACVRTVAFGDDAVLLDIDTPDGFSRISVLCSPRTPLRNPGASATGLGGLK